MASLDLATLRTAKIALGEDLITQDDFLLIKKAFLKAQQIKAGLDAGFIREEDYQQARDSFLHSLDFTVSATMSSPYSSNGGAIPTPGPSPTQRLQPTTSLGTQPAPGSSRNSSFSRPPSQFPVSQITPAAAQLSSAGSDSLPPPSYSLPAVAPAQPRLSYGATVPVPTDMPRSTRANSSMSAGKVGQHIPGLTGVNILYQ